MYSSHPSISHVPIGDGLVDLRIDPPPAGVSVVFISSRAKSRTRSGNILYQIHHYNVWRSCFLYLQLGFFLVESLTICFFARKADPWIGRIRGWLYRSA